MRSFIAMITTNLMIINHFNQTADNITFHPTPELAAKISK